MSGINIYFAHESSGYKKGIFVIVLLSSNKYKLIGVNIYYLYLILLVYFNLYLIKHYYFYLYLTLHLKLKMLELLK